MSDLPPANWYPDPEDPSQQRYWDGTQWTEHRAPAAGSAPSASQPAGGQTWSSSDTGATGGADPAAGQAWGQQPGHGQTGAAAPGAATPAWGQQQPGYGQAYAPATPGGSNGLAITSMIIGIISFFLGFIVIGAVGGVVAVVLGFMGLRRIKEQPQGGRGLAITGIITGGLAILVGIGMMLFFFVIGAAVEQGSTGFTDFFECIEEEARTGQDLDC